MTTNLNQRVIESRQRLQDLPLSVINPLCDHLIAELGEPSSEVEEEALRFLLSGDYDAAKKHCLHDPCNSFLAAISCIASAYRSPMVADSVLRDAARHTAETVKHKAERRIAESFQRILSQSQT
jgi:hypothetical protein